MEERDNTYDTILRRYKQANECAIVKHDRISFDSLRDIFFLVKRCKQLEERLSNLESELMVAKTQKED